ncbi:hypothetical protein BST95_17240 [Halioglobus japonicus]|uniref:Response regulator n=1 Tax=Halioglobus japonicus TaxID=930805 RepID=A0AAP8MG68_9GAMM|nr:response regulator [Halioglobus japonicus]AQA19728.1 hypothetical protein BST95_17240 [Halioglobus japonicus]PLW87201.1 hypothetical protein C0029_00975 [Halioglobus japonicus]GHD09691.1 hypothetical protein GCM10007052_08100 [Halioglobus japonicus]
MHTDENKVGSQDAADGLDSAQEAMVLWLMDELDKDEPTEKLFVVDRQDPVDMSLSAFEAEIAARPMQRGKDGADSFDAYVGEEVVMSSDGASSDIYRDSMDESLSEDLEIEEVMALDFSRDGDVGVFEGKIDVQDGDDILGLEDDDDIGETYLKVKRVKRGDQVDAAPAPVAAEPVEAVAPVNVTEPVEAAPAATEPETLAPAVQVTESAVEQVDEVESAATETEPAADSVEDYIAENPAPVDDEAFDDYLVAGGELGEAQGDIGGLELVAMEPVVDVEPDEPVDLPEEIQEVAELGESILAAVTPLIAPLMEELNMALGARLVAMGRPADSVYADFSMATDESSANLAQQQDYARVMDIFTAIPASLAELTDTQRDAIFLRLCWMDSGEICNNLFRESGERGVIEIDTPPVLRAVDNNVFEESILDDDLDADLAPSGWEPGQEDTDIDALFDEFDGGDDLAAAEPAAESSAVETAPEPTFVAKPEPEPEPQQPAVAAAAPQDAAWCIPAHLSFIPRAPEGANVLENFLDAFAEEGTSEVAALAQILNAWEAELDGDAPTAEIARILHTLKGISNGVGLAGFGTLMENYEILFEGLPAPTGDLAPDYFRIMRAWQEAAAQGVAAIKANRCDIGNVFPYAAMPEEHSAEAAVVVEEALELPEEADTASPEAPPVPEPMADESAAPAELGEMQALTAQETDLRAATTDLFVAIEARLGTLRSLIYAEQNPALQGELDGLAELIAQASRNNASAEALLEQQAVAMQSLGGQTEPAVAVAEPAEPVPPAPQEVVDGVFALVVDDSRTQRMVATSQLGGVGAETETAENGALAIEWLNSTDRLPNIILLDVEMPVKDGIQTLREIRESSRYGHLPVIMVTSRTGAKHRALAEEAGCNGYMGKPFNFRALVGQINELTGQNLEIKG